VKGLLNGITIAILNENGRLETSFLLPLKIIEISPPESAKLCSELFSLLAKKTTTNKQTKQKKQKLIGHKHWDARQQIRGEAPENLISV